MRQRKNISYRQRRSIEIYFVLYLSALIFLLPDKRTEEGKAASAVLSLIESHFSLRTDLQTMLCRVVQTGDSLKIVSFDSLNAITPTQGYTDIRYEFSIEEPTAKKTIRLASENQPQSYFRYSTSYDRRQSALFTWTPSLSTTQNKLYSVTVTATATPILTALPTQEREYIESLLRVGGESLRVKATTKFAVALIYADATSSQGNNRIIAALEQLNPALLSGRDSTLMREINSIRLLQQSLATSSSALNPTNGTSPSINNLQNSNGQLQLQARSDFIRTIPNSEWENRLTVFGADPQRDLEGTPVITGSKAYVKIEGNELVVRGMSPVSGQTETIQVAIQRASDKREASLIFKVSSQTIDEPLFPQTMYPGITYTFQPNLPFVSGNQTAIALRNPQGVIRAQSQGEQFIFTPSLSDTNDVYSLERTINGKKFGQVYSIAVNSFPAPEIIDISKVSGNAIRVRTRSYGIGNDNSARVRLEPSAGIEGKIQEMYGDYSYDKKYFVHLQVFMIAPQSKRVSIRAVAIGSRKTSQLRELPERD